MAHLIQQVVGLLLCSVAVLAAPSPTCLDASGNPVDWFIGIKVPDYIDSNPQNGKQYFLMTSTYPRWKLSNCTVQDTCGAVYNTMNQTYDRLSGDESVTVLYNDEWPPESTLRFRGASYHTYGHMKGALSFAINGNGFWMIHSVPKFSQYHHYEYPDTGLRYGQHFLCVTFPFSQLAQIAHQLSIARPDTFAFNLPSSLADSSPDLYAVAHRKPPPSSADSLQHQLTSLGGVSFTYFSKSRNFNADLYGDFVAPSLKTAIFMEGWVNGQGDLNSTCGADYPVYRVEGVQLARDEWTTTHDHSKWVVSASQSSPWVCLGDINRQKSQFHRGGGTLCLSNTTVWGSFRQLVEDYQHCQN